MYRFTRVSAQCAFWVGKKVLVHVDKQTIANTPTLEPFGGTVAGIDEDRTHLKRKLGAKWFEGEHRPGCVPNDISCLVPTGAAEDEFREWLDNRQPDLPIAEIAQKKIQQEFEKLGVPLRLANAVRCGAFKRYDQSGSFIRTYAGKGDPNAMHYVYVVQCGVPQAAEGEIEGLVERSERLHFITRADVRKGSIRGTVNSKDTKILVPAALDLLFR